MDQRHSHAEEGACGRAYIRSCTLIEAQILDLEARLQEALHDNSAMASLPAGFNRRNNPDWLPTASSSKHTLTGHRDQVNAVAFHPVYSVIVSASDDSTMKVWDWETGEMERTLKGHTKRVTDCEYDSKGKSLGTFSRFPFLLHADGTG